MMPIHELLNRIQWDQAFGQGEFEIGYHDRIAGGIIRVPLREIFFEPGDRFAFDLLDDEGELHSIPLHCIKEALISRHCDDCMDAGGRVPKVGAFRRRRSSYRGTK